MSPERLLEIREHIDKSKRRNIHKGSIWIKAARDLLEERDRLEASVGPLERERKVLVAEIRRALEALMHADSSIKQD